MNLFRRNMFPDNNPQKSKLEQGLFSELFRFHCFVRSPEF
jgi:hypothetical protein